MVCGSNPHDGAFFTMIKGRAMIEWMAKCGVCSATEESLACHDFGQFLFPLPQLLLSFEKFEGFLLY